MFTIYLFYMENKIMDSEDKDLESDIKNKQAVPLRNEYLVLESSSSGRKFVKDLFFVYLPRSVPYGRQDGGYYSLYANKENNYLNNKEKIQAVQREEFKRKYT